MRTGEGVLSQHLRTLCLSDASLELPKLGFDEADPGPALPASRRYECTDLSKCEPGVLAEVDQRHALGARGAVVPSSPCSTGR